jgi:hypothetical protein
MYSRATILCGKLNTNFLKACILGAKGTEGIVPNSQNITDIMDIMNAKE